MNGFSIPMAMVDFLPVALFLAGNLLIWKDLSGKMSPMVRSVYLSGVVLVVAAGFLKAFYKLLCAAGAGDLEWMSRQFFSNQSLGFLLAGLGLMLSHGSHKKKRDRTYALLPTMALVGLIIIGETFMYTALCRYALKLKKPAAAVILGISFILSLGMGYLSSRDFSVPAVNWIAQGINICSQGAFLISVWIMHKGRNRQAVPAPTLGLYVFVKTDVFLRI